MSSLHLESRKFDPCLAYQPLPKDMINSDELADRIVDFINNLFKLNDDNSKISPVTWPKLTGEYEISTDAGSSFAFEITAKTRVLVALNLLDHYLQVMKYASTPHEINWARVSRHSSLSKEDYIKQLDIRRAQAQVTYRTLAAWHDANIPPALMTGYEYSTD